jgi:hypothetical protein
MAFPRRAGLGPPACFARDGLYGAALGFTIVKTKWRRTMMSSKNNQRPKSVRTCEIAAESPLAAQAR